MAFNALIYVKWTLAL